MTSKNDARGNLGRFKPGVRGNPSGRPKTKRKTLAESMTNLPLVLERMIRTAANDTDWLERLRESSPDKYASLLTSLARIAENTENKTVQAQADADSVKIVMADVRPDNLEDGQQGGRPGVFVRDLMGDRVQFIPNTTKAQLMAFWQQIQSEPVEGARPGPSIVMSTRNEAESLQARIDRTRELLGDKWPRQVRTADDLFAWLEGGLKGGESDSLLRQKYTKAMDIIKNLIDSPGRIRAFKQWLTRQDDLKVEMDGHNIELQKSRFDMLKMCDDPDDDDFDPRSSSVWQKWG